MLRRLLKNYLAEEDAQDAAATPILDRERLRTLCEQFAIGRKIRYSPEFQRDIVFRTIVLAYRVNEHLIYSRDAIRCDTDDLPVGFMCEGLKRPLVPEQARSFQLVVPDTSDMERSLDYVRRASLSRTGQFTRGNTITLIAEAGRRGVASLDTQVDGRIALKDGPYLNSQMILLRPDFETLRIADQRQKARIDCDMPARLLVRPNAPAATCVLADFSDASLRLRAAPDSPLPAMKLHDKVIVEMDFGNAAPTCRLRGLVFRIAPDSCVVKFHHLDKHGQFVPIEKIDVLEIKTALLNRCA